jgi:hypothetical protein
MKHFPLWIALLTSERRDNYWWAVWVRTIGVKKLTREMDHLESIVARPKLKELAGH